MYVHTREGKCRCGFHIHIRFLNITSFNLQKVPVSVSFPTINLPIPSTIINQPSSLGMEKLLTEEEREQSSQRIYKYEVSQLFTFTSRTTNRNNTPWQCKKSVKYLFCAFAWIYFGIFECVAMPWIALLSPTAPSSPPPPPRKHRNGCWWWNQNNNAHLMKVFQPEAALYCKQPKI